MKRLNLLEHVVGGLEFDNIEVIDNMLEGILFQIIQFNDMKNKEGRNIFAYELDLYGFTNKIEKLY